MSPTEPPPSAYRMPAPRLGPTHAPVGIGADLSPGTVLAAYRVGIDTVMLPRENEKDLAEIPDDVAKQIEFRLVENMDEVLETALTELPPTLELGDDAGGDKVDDREGPVAH